ncbi:MAG: zinc ribbon domain-containing protein [Candidatus Sulfotelmatobacter sp.]
MLCSKCAANLPEGSQFCLKCGQPVSTPATDIAPPAATAILACSKCGTSLPQGSEFCLKCGKPVSVPPKSAAADRPKVVDTPPAELPRPRRKRRIFRWILLAAVIVVIVWVMSSDSPVAQAVQEAVGWKHDQTILDTSFSIGPHTFRYYKFALPAGSVNVAVVGQFATVSDKQKEKDRDGDLDNSIEVYVLTEGAFTIWQNGYATTALYESGRVAEGAIRTDLPAGEGIYYLIFSNKLAPKTAKNVHASALLRYKSWLPEWFRRMKDRFWNWFGL